MKQLNIVEKILNFTIESDTIAVAVSGGEDSMVLLDAVKKSASICPFDFFVVNIEHGIRGESSKADSTFVKDYCDKNHIKIEQFFIKSKEYSKENGLTLEEGARKLRYEVFDNLLKSKKCNKIFLAHHQSDQAETVLMRIIRGTGIQGLCGMKEVSGGYVRPLLTVTKEEIKNYIKENKIPYVVDETNFDNDYTRNLLRNEIIPQMKKISSDVEGALTRLSRIATENDDFISSLVGDIVVDDDLVYLPLIKDENKLLFKRRVEKCFKALGVVKDIEERHYEILWDFKNLSNGASVDMPFSIVATLEYDKIVFCKKVQKSNLTIPFVIGKVDVFDNHFNIVPYNNTQIKKGQLIFDRDMIPQNAVFRTRKVGDYFTKFGGGTKSLGDYFTDKKVPKRLRDNIVLLCDESEVLLIVGYEISDKIKVTDKNKKSIYLLQSED